MIAGPNGAGKTTTALAFIGKEGETYEDLLNADEIARGLAPLYPETVALEASKLMLKRFRTLLDLNKSFIFETTGAATLYVKYLQAAKQKGYLIDLLFLWLPTPEQAIQRVAHRVKQGGHSIPEDDIRRRYYRGIKNLLNYYLPLADTAVVVNNSSAELKRVIVNKESRKGMQIEDKEAWQEIQRVAQCQSRV